MTTTEIAGHYLADVTQLPMPLSDIDQLITAMRGLNTPDTRAWSTGFVIGFIAGHSQDQALVDDVTDAGRAFMAAPFTADEALTRWGMLGTANTGQSRSAYLRACGVLVGWRKGTDHLPDADLCVLDERRILTRTEGVSCEHGWFCDPDCQASMCRRDCGQDGLDL